MNFNQSKISQKLLSLGMLLAITACGNQSVSSDGSCTEKFVADYNAIVEANSDIQQQIQSIAEAQEVEKYEVTQMIKSFDTLLEKCKSFESSHANTQCKATQVMGYKETTINASKVSTLCSESAEAKVKLEEILDQM